MPGEVLWVAPEGPSCSFCLKSFSLTSLGHSHGGKGRLRAASQWYEVAVWDESGQEKVATPKATPSGRQGAWRG